LGSNPLEEDRNPLKLRTFFGLPVPEARRKELEPYLAACAAAGPEFRWVPADNLHLTVRFIGSVERAVVEDIAGRLATRPLQGFELGLGGIGTFKRGRLVRVVSLQLSSGVEAARELAAEVEAECVRAGLTPETRPLQPHLTLARARAREGARLPPLPDPPRLDPWRAHELVLFKSQLGRAGSVYEPLLTIRLS
jgi:2'-5' RNA ligase